MPLQDVADHRDVRAPRLIPSASQFASAHNLRRSVSIATLVAIDSGAFVLAILLVPPASGLGWIALWPGLSWPPVLFACAVIVVVAALRGLYGRRHARHNVRALLTAWTIAFVATLVLLLFLDPQVIGARYVVAWVAAFGLAVAARYLYDALVALAYGVDGDAPPALLLGSLDSCLSALPALAALNPESRVHVVGLVVSDKERSSRPKGAAVPPIVADHEHLKQALATSGASQVIIADPAALNGQLRDVMSACQSSGVALKIVSQDLGLYADAVSYVPGLDHPLFVVRPQAADAGSYVLKQVGDRVGAALVLILLAPLLLALALLIKVTSRGPVLFVDRRVGVGQRVFRCYKFRTMIEGAQEAQGSLEERNEAGDVLFKVRQDPRVTRVGGLLRRLSLDEMPQLINVLKGDMSLVGPRPLPLRDYDLMEDNHRRRHVMLPGITGLWQVSGRSDLSFDDMMRLDLQYMETWSLMSDLNIMWRTTGAVLFSRGAY